MIQLKRFAFVLQYLFNGEQFEKYGDLTTDGRKFQAI